MELSTAIEIGTGIGRQYDLLDTEVDAIKALIACAKERIMEDAAVTAYLQRTGRIDPSTAEALAEWQAGLGVDSTATAKAILDEVDKRADAAYGKVGEVDLSGRPEMYAGATDIAKAIIRDAEKVPAVDTWIEEAEQIPTMHRPPYGRQREPVEPEAIMYVPRIMLARISTLEDALRSLRTEELEEEPGSWAVKCISDHNAIIDEALKVESPEMYTCHSCGWVGLARNTAHGCSRHRETRLNAIKARQAGSSGDTY